VSATAEHAASPRATTNGHTATRTPDTVTSNGSGRSCACGCGRSLEGYRKSRKWATADCARRGEAPAPARVKTDTPVRPSNGPDSYFTDELPASRGQLASIAVLACELLHVNPPKTRLAASLALARLRMALDHAPTPPPLATGDARAAVQQATPADAETVVDGEAKDAETRRLLRQRDRTAGVTHRCGSCKLFVANPADRCPHCGFEPDMGW
jgi:hypothetical protein